MSAPLTSNRLVFIGGLHRSGTTLLADLLGEHRDVSSLRETGVWHDEGQFLQDLMPTAGDCGGPGRFAFGTGAHLTEADVADPRAAATSFLTSWTPFWDLDRRYFVEKSPPNLLRFRYLQEVFPEALFIAIVRHPIAVAYATQHWAKASIPDLVEHWLHAHEVFEADRKKLKRIEFLRYEDLVHDAVANLANLDRTLGIAPHAPETAIKTDTNARYLRRFRHARVLPRHPRVGHTTARFGRRLDALGYGYRFDDAP